MKNMRRVHIRRKHPLFRLVILLKRRFLQWIIPPLRYTFSRIKQKPEPISLYPLRSIVTLREAAEISKGSYLELHPPTSFELAAPERIAGKKGVVLRAPGLIDVGGVGAATLCNPHVVGTGGTIFLSGGELLWDASPEFGVGPKHHSIYRRMIHKGPQSRKGKYATIACGSGSNIYHWLFDILPRLQLIQEAGHKLDELDGLYCPPVDHEFQSTTLSYLNVPRGLILETSDELCDMPEELIIPSALLRVERSAWVIEFLRNALLPGAPPPLTASTRLIHISRKNANGRRLRNEPAVRALLAGFGFQSVELEQMSFWDQVNVVRGADVIVAEHGAGLSHICFCRKGTLVIELLPRGWPIECFRKIASLVGLRYRVVIGRSNGWSDSFRRLNLFVDFEVDIGNLQEILSG